MNGFRFKELKVYQQSKKLHSGILKISRNFPERFFYLRNQLERASLSIILNIAEGSGKDSDKDFRRYIQNSLGSINEVAACLDICSEVRLIKKREFDSLIKDCIDLKNQLGSFSKILKKAIG